MTAIPGAPLVPRGAYRSIAAIGSYPRFARRVRGRALAGMAHARPLGSLAPHTPRLRTSPAHGGLLPRSNLFAIRRPRPFTMIHPARGRFPTTCPTCSRYFLVSVSQLDPPIVTAAHRFALRLLVQDGEWARRETTAIRLASLRRASPRRSHGATEPTRGWLETERRPAI